MDTSEKGRRFSQAYLSFGEPTTDSDRMRRRVSTVLLSLSDSLRNGLGLRVEREQGVEVDSHSYGYSWHSFIKRCEIRDVLDLVTTTYLHLRSKGASAAADKWIADTRRIFAEENVRYQIDDTGGVHFAIDKEFESNRAATIAVLNSSRYVNSLNEFEQAHTYLSATPPNGKGAVRSTFTAAEGLFRLMFPSSPRLTSREIDKCFVPLIQQVNSHDAAAQGASIKLVEGFKAWVDASHFYRHEPGQEKIAQPPLPLAIQLVSSGGTQIRWLAEIDSLNSTGK